MIYIKYYYSNKQHYQTIISDNYRSLLPIIHKKGYYIISDIDIGFPIHIPKQTGFHLINYYNLSDTQFIGTSTLSLFGAEYSIEDYFVISINV